MTEFACRDRLRDSKQVVNELRNLADIGSWCDGQNAKDLATELTTERTLLVECLNGYRHYSEIGEDSAPEFLRVLEESHYWTILEEVQPLLSQKDLSLWSDDLVDRCFDGWIETYKRYSALLSTLSMP